MLSYWRNARSMSHMGWVLYASLRATSISILNMSWCRDWRKLFTVHLESMWLILRYLIHLFVSILSSRAVIVAGKEHSLIIETIFIFSSLWLLPAVRFLMIVFRLLLLLLIELLLKDCVRRDYIEIARKQTLLFLQMLLNDGATGGPLIVQIIFI